MDQWNTMSITGPVIALGRIKREEQKNLFLSKSKNGTTATATVHVVVVVLGVSFSSCLVSSR
jgi:hypothetical protein